MAMFLMLSSIHRRTLVLDLLDRPGVAVLRAHSTNGATPGMPRRRRSDVACWKSTTSDLPNRGGRPGAAYPAANLTTHWTLPNELFAVLISGADNSRGPGARLVAPPLLSTRKRDAVK